MLAKIAYHTGYYAPSSLQQYVGHNFRACILTSLPEKTRQPDYLKNVIAKTSLAALSPQFLRPFGNGFF